MSRTLVVSQPMFLPWIGLFEQVRLADVFLHYDDVQLPQGRSFMSRVQIKTADGVHWLTAPIDRQHSGRLLNEVRYIEDRAWRDKHLKTLGHAYARAPHSAMMLELAEAIYAQDTCRLDLFNAHAIETLAGTLGLDTRFERSSESGVGGSSTQRLIDLCLLYQADTYVTGHGAARYLDHEAFEHAGITVRYMDYQLARYEQCGGGAFTPYVSILDAIACCGTGACSLIKSPAIDWKESRVVRPNA